MPRPSKLPTFRKHLLDRGYAIATLNVYVWAAAAVLDAVADRTEENLRAYFEGINPAKRATIRAAWRSYCDHIRERDGVEVPRGDAVPAEATPETAGAAPSIVADVARALRTQNVSARKVLTITMEDLRRFGEHTIVDLRDGLHAMLPTAKVNALIAWGYPGVVAMPEDPLFATPGSRQPLPYGVLLSALQRHA